MRPAESFNRTNVTELGLETEAGLETPWMLTEADWWIVKEGLAKTRIYQGGVDLAEFAAAIAVLDRDRLHLKDTDLKKMNDSLIMARLGRNTADVLLIGAALHTITGVSPLNHEDWSDIRENFQKRQQKLMASDIKRLALDAAIMTEMGQPPEISSTHWVAMKETLHNQLQGKKIVPAVDLAHSMTILDPAQVDFSDQDWELMVARMTKAREQKKSPRTMLQMSVALTKLARIKHPTVELSTNVPPLPETKSYTS